MAELVYSIEYNCHTAFSSKQCKWSRLSPALSASSCSFDFTALLNWIRRTVFRSPPFRSATWDVTVMNTLTTSCLAHSAACAASAAEDAALRKTAKYTSLSQIHHFYPVAIETLGPLCASGVEFITDIGRRIIAATSDPRETALLFQRLSVAMQRYIAVCLANTFVFSDSTL